MQRTESTPTGVQRGRRSACSARYQKLVIEEFEATGIFRKCGGRPSPDALAWRSAAVSFSVTRQDSRERVWVDLEVAAPAYLESGG